MYISDSMLNRPSRVLYIKQFSNLEAPLIKEIIADMVPDTSMHQPALEYLSSLEIITVDIVKAVCAEMVRFSEVPNAFKSIMNIKQRRSMTKNAYHLLGGKENLICSGGLVDPPNILRLKLTDPDEEYHLSLRDPNMTDWQTYGRILSVDPDKQTVTTEQGIFKITESRCHPSLAQTMAVTC
jgi:hypothetical protein